MTWSHVTDLPPEIKQVMDAELERARIEDHSLETATIRAIRESRLAMRIPGYVRALQVCNPELKVTRAFVVVALVTGLSELYIRNLYYQSERGRR